MHIRIYIYMRPSLRPSHSFFRSRPASVFFFASAIISLHVLVPDHVILVNGPRTDCPRRSCECPIRSFSSLLSYLIIPFYFHLFNNCSLLAHCSSLLVSFITCDCLWY